MYYVYILQSQKDKSYYTGTTEDLKQRIKNHNWHLAKYSSTKTPFVLVWFCGFRDKRKSLDFEKYLKSGSGFAFRNKHLI
jgi:putative endonuclease